MKSIFEIELKYIILDRHLLQPFLAQCENFGRRNVVDTYFDTIDGSLISRGIYVRQRNQRLDIKFNRECLADPDLAKQTYCEEYSFDIPLREKDRDRLASVCSILGLHVPGSMDFESFLSTNNLALLMVIDKVRTSYRHGQFKIIVDDIKNVGSFLEIEVSAATLDCLNELELEMACLLEGLPLERSYQGSAGHVLRKVNPALYAKDFYVRKVGVDVR